MPLKVLTVVASPSMRSDTDDAQDVFAQLVAADAILFATPFSMCSDGGQLKPVLDRTLRLLREDLTPKHRSSAEGKPTAVLVSADRDAVIGGASDDREDAPGLRIIVSSRRQDVR
jgi:multimeric flavodoxin WrbA